MTMEEGLRSRVSAGAAVARSCRALAVCFALLALTAAGVQAATYYPAVSTDYLANPGIGFQAMHDLDDPVLPETVAYRRPQYAWKDQNPAEGVYDWSAVDADLAAAVAAGKQFSFRIYTMRGESFGGHQVPQWVLDKGAEIAGGQPRYNNCVYQQEWAEFVEVLRQRYDGDPDIAFIDISGYGNFNEWSWQNQTQWDDDFMNPATLDGMARKRLADMFIGGSGAIDCRAPGGGQETVSYSYPGFSQTQLLMPYAGIQQSTRYVAARRSDVGIRHDCLGSASHTDGMLQKVGDVIAATWAAAPIVYELCGPENMADALAVLQATHGSLVHENAGGNDIGELTATLLYAGYRFAPVSIEHQAAVAPGATLDLAMTWRNLGFAPAYPSMGQSFALYFHLLDGDGAAAADWAIAADLSSWMPADPIGSAPPEQFVSQSLPVPAGLATGAYSAAVSVVDTRSGQPIKLAVGGADGAGYYRLDSVVVTNGEICGDGVVNSGVGELCDDGNTAAGDCCAPDCSFEAGACDDGDACTGGDACGAGICQGSTAVDCDDGVTCTVDTCDPASGCAYTPDDALCDDGFACTQDLCSGLGACSNTPSDALCDDQDLCTVDSCDPVTRLCVNGAAPWIGCRRGAGAKLSLGAKNGRNRLSFGLTGADTPASALGTPDIDGGTDYALCIYDGPGAAASLQMSANLPGGMQCGSHSCWKLRNGRVKYKQSSLAPGGVKTATITAGKPGRDKIKLKGEGGLLDLPPPASQDSYFTLSQPLSVQTVNSEGECWQAEFDQSSARRNEADGFKASVR